MNRIPYPLLFVLGACLLLAACSKKVEPTTIEIKDPDRHYYPVLQGQQIELTFRITNTGENPLIIKEIQPTCGCIVASRKSTYILVPKGGSDYIHLTYNSTKNVGYVAHTIRLYGNIIPDGMAVLKFDINVVPDADYTRDYEELYRDYSIQTGVITEMVEGLESERGYYVGEP